MTSTPASRARGGILTKAFLFLAAVLAVVTFGWDRIAATLSDTGRQAAGVATLTAAQRAFDDTELAQFKPSGTVAAGGVKVVSEASDGAFTVSAVVRENGTVLDLAVKAGTTCVMSTTQYGQPARWGQHDASTVACTSQTVAGLADQFGSNPVLIPDVNTPS